MAKQLQLRRGTTSQHSSFTGLVGEVTVDTDKDVVVIHDGSTAGGEPLATEASVALKANTTNAVLVTPNLGTPSAGTIDADNVTISNIAIGAECTGASTDLTDTAALTYNADADVSANAWVLDEDAMGTDSATKLATQQSIKAYVDTTVSATNELLEDSTPQLGGSLDVLAQVITTSTSGGHIAFDKGITEKIGTPANATASGTTCTVDLSTGNFFIADLEGVSGDVATFTISNVDATVNQVNNFVLKVIQGTTTTTRNFTWATIVSNGTNIDWAGGAGPDITTGGSPDKIDIFSFTSYDNGTTWYGAIVGQDFS
tara:strand:- start:12 stop:956 length:945 start_codon:yes stop_codon:yes gene_type:complete